MTEAAVPSGVREVPATAAQHGAWFLAALAPEAGSGRARAYRVRGDLDVDALRAAWLAVVGRHDALRTTIGTRAGRPVQRVAAAAEDATLARLRVEPVGPGEHVVRIELHELVCDDESAGIVLAELSSAYAAAVAGGPGLGGTPPQYGDHAPRSDEGALDWWRAALTPPPPALDLPVDRERPPAPSSEAGVLRFAWDVAVDALSDVEPVDVVLAAFQALLHRYTGEERVAVGSAVSVRPAELAGAVGAFGNTVVLCADLTDAPTFRALVGQVSAVRREALARREVPFQEVVQAVCDDRDPRRVPMCDAVFVAGGGTPELSLAGTSVEPLPADTVPARADLTLVVDRTAPVLAGALEYRACLFDRASAELILAQLHTLLTAALADPDRPVPDLPLDTPDRLSATARAADRRPDGQPASTPANALVHRAAADAPDAAAISWQGGTTSYADLRADAARITAALPRDLAGSPVVVRMATGPRQVAATLAVLDTGAHLICLGGGDTGDRGRTVLEDLRPACLVVDGAAGDDPLAAWYAEELDGHVVDVADLPADGAGGPAPVVPGSSDRAYVAYTSGSTGQPKGIPQSHGTLAQFVTWFAEEFRVGPGSRVAQWAAPGYDASLCEVFAALVAGATVCPVPDRIRANPEKIVDWLAAERITHFQTVPSFAREVLRVAGGAPERLGALNHLLLAGERLPGDLVNGLRTTLPAVRLVNLYGPTELILATWHEITGPVHGTAPVGRPIPGRRVVVVDAQDRACPTGVTGEIVIVSPHVTPGYLGAAGGDRARFRPLDDSGPCYRTGDLGRLRWDGALEFRGRKDFQVKFSGIRLELGDIEAALAAHESVAECAVVAVPDADRLVTRLVAYVVPQRGPDGKATGAPSDWRAALRARFGKAMPPVAFQTLIGMPRNVGGKVDRRRLPAPAATTRRTVRGPETVVERAIAEIWSELDAETTTVDDAFFSVGGHSLLIPVLLHEIHARFGVAIPLWEYFANPTVAGLAALVEPHTAAAGHDA
ncbi:non-ribosomal peptide synthetase [Actinokineospora fastidiosa]|uniref:Carrier domain-containing protein n=1 Tax=Actinokineospora fastidiosa TaxID=1816 RepID=A0A918GTP5_9PSEU|nr:AMP-binding protein [Actinokineospora fastidiosa]GGS57929.1 hypothetical protein GCM10010171_61190 [Actinokineospora fastidiosa]